jgi:ribokinase
MFDAVGFGALNLDKIFMVDKIPKKDEEGFVRKIELHPGGSSANTIVGLSKLGMRTSFIGKTGNDGDGRVLIEDFRRQGVDTSFIIMGDGRSGNAMIFVDDEGNRAILVDPGVNDTIEFNEINPEVFEKAKLIHLTSFICKNGIQSFESQKMAVEIAKEKGIYITFDPGLIYIERGLKELETMIRGTTIFLPNRKELELLMNMDYVDASRELISMGCKIVAVKMGAEGCYVTNGKEEVTVKPFTVEVVDTTGAGDAFNAGFIYGFLKGYSLGKCGRIGNFVASRNIQKVGARAGLPSKDEFADAGIE